MMPARGQVRVMSAQGLGVCTATVGLDMLVGPFGGPCRARNLPTLADKSLVQDDGRRSQFAAMPPQHWPRPGR